MTNGLRFTPIDPAAWNRYDLFCYFSQTAPTGYSLTVNVEVTRLRQTLKAAGFRFFPAYLWLVTKGLNEQMAFKIAQKDGQLGYYEGLTPLYAAFHPDDHTFSLMWTEYRDSFPAFHQAYLDNQAAYGAHHGVLSQTDRLPPPNAYTVSCLPWISFQHFAVHSYGRAPYYFPSVKSGRFVEKHGQTLLPLSITCHHAATDGWHVSRFLDRLQARADGFEAFLAP